MKYVCLQSVNTTNVATGIYWKSQFIMNVICNQSKACVCSNRTQVYYDNGREEKPDSRCSLCCSLLIDKQMKRYSFLTF